MDANIAITPATAVNPTGTNHVLTITVNAVNGTLDAGSHTATATIESGPGSFVGGNTCDYTGGGTTASCTVTITSAVTGTTVVSATSDIHVSAQTITRTTGTAANTTAGGSGNASKTWADARITISPSGTNQVGDPHTFTVLVEKHNGTGWAPAAGVIDQHDDDFGSITGGTCGPTGPDQRLRRVHGHRQLDTPGTATVKASGTVTVDGVQIAVATNGYGAHDISNIKTWVDARITISQNGDQPGRPSAYVHGLRREERRDGLERRRRA